MQGDGLDIGAIVDVLRRRARTGLAIFAGLMILAVVIILLLPTRYAATALVAVDPSRIEPLQLDFAAPPLGSVDAARVESEVEIIRSVPTLLRIVDLADLLENPDVLGRPVPIVPAGEATSADWAMAMEWLVPRLRIERRGLTYITAITAETASPALSAQIANAAAQAYLEGQVAAKRQALTQALDLLGQRRSELGLSPAIGGDVVGMNRLTQRMSDLEGQLDLQVADSRIVANAPMPLLPSFPNTRLLLVFAAISSAVLAIAAVLAVDAYAGGFHSLEELESATGREVVSTLPATMARRSGWKTRPGPPPDLDNLDGHSAYAESLRHLRFRLDGALATGAPPDAERGRVILMTSALPQEGKSISALLLARAYGGMGKKVLLLDADLRTPAIGRLMGIAGGTGLHDYLRGKMLPDRIDAILAADPMTGISVVPGFGVHRQSVENLLAGRPMAQLIQAAGRAYDIVIIDTPPVGRLVDAAYLARFCDAAVLLVRWSRTPQRDVLRALDTMAHAGRPNLPVLLAMTEYPAAQHFPQIREENTYA